MQSEQTNYCQITAVLFHTHRIMAPSCARGDLDGVLRKISSPKQWSSIGTGCVRKWRSDHPWKCSKDMQMWCLGTRVSGGHGSAGLDLFQPMRLYDSIRVQTSAQADEQWGNPCMRAQHKATENYVMNISASSSEYPEYITSLFI